MFCSKSCVYFEIRKCNSDDFEFYCCLFDEVLNSKLDKVIKSKYCNYGTGVE